MLGIGIFLLRFGYNNFLSYSSPEFIQFRNVFYISDNFSHKQLVLVTTPVSTGVSFLRALGVGFWVLAPDSLPRNLVFFYVQVEKKSFVL